MKTQPPVLMIGLAVIFAVALILTLVLICMSFSGIASNLPEESGTDGQPPLSLSPLPTGSEANTGGILLPPGSSAATTEATTAATLPDIGNGLSYLSYGNGTCKVSGIGSCIDACVVIPEYSPAGDLVIEIAPAAFYECATVTAVQIPASVERIGELAFAACNNLMYISVSSQNVAYCDVDGVLYNASRSTLILYPPLHAGTELFLDRRTVRIAEMAFYRCAYLKTVHYLGSPEEWDAMLIGSKNYALAAASMTFGG